MDAGTFEYRNSSVHYCDLSRGLTGAPLPRRLPDRAKSVAVGSLHTVPAEHGSLANASTTNTCFIQSCVPRCQGRLLQIPINTTNSNTKCQLVICLVIIAVMFAIPETRSMPCGVLRPMVNTGPEKFTGHYQMISPRFHIYPKPQ